MSVPATVTLRSLFDAHARFVGRTLRQLGLRSDLEDACQDVFVVAHRRLPEFVPGTSERAWLYAIAANVAKTRRRSYARRREAVAADGVVDPEDRKRADAGDRELAIVLLDGLDDDQRLVVILHDVEGVAMREITESLGIPLQTGYSRLRLARQKLKRMLEELRAKEAR